MTQAIYVNLPVTNLEASMAFYQALGLTKDPRFSDETAVAMAWSDTICVMLLTHDKWRTFTDRPIPPPTSSEVMLALSCEKRDDVDRMCEAAAAAGGTADINPAQDHGWYYGRDIIDPDGHAWGPFWMDMDAAPQGE